MRRLRISARRIRVGEIDDITVRARLRLRGPGERPIRRRGRRFLARRRGGDRS